MGKINTLILNVFVFFLRIYQYAISPLLGSCCRFHPSCSDYAIDAFKTHQFGYGSYLTLKRLLRCHPWCQGGLDPVPEKTNHVDHYV